MPLSELRRSPVLARLAERGIALLAAVQPADREDAFALVERARELGLSIGLWPLLENARGRWLHPDDAEGFAAHVDAVLEGLDRRGLAVDTVALDLEPPITEVRRLLDGELGAARAWLRRRLESAVHRRLVATLAARGVEVVAAAAPPVLLAGRASRGWQRALGTPVDGVPYDTVTAMLYTSLFEGYALGTIDRADARALLARFAALARRRFGERASISLGAVGRGALGDERTYRSERELADDVAIARAAGVEDLALFDLAGVLARPPAERWLDALVETAPQAGRTPATARSGAAMALLAIAGVALDLWGPPPSEVR